MSDPKIKKNASAADVVSSAPDPTAQAARQTFTRASFASTGVPNKTRASFFIGDTEGNRLPVKIVGPDEQEITPDEIVVPPDGGYGYVIVFAAFMSNVIVDGIVFSFGSLKDSISAASIAHGTPLDQATLAWVGSLLTGFYLLTGPFVSAVANKFGFRTVAILGSLIASSAFVISFFLNQNGPRIGYLILFYGVMGGIGFSCIYVPAVIAVGFYFEKKRALATGVAICGSGIGNFLFPPFITQLTKWFQWHGAICALGVIVLLCALLGILYRPLKPKKRKVSVVTSVDGTPEGTPLLMRIKRARDMMKKWDSVNSFISNRESFTEIQKAAGDDPKARSEALYNRVRKTSTSSLKGVTAPVAIPVPGMQRKRLSVPSMYSASVGDSPVMSPGNGQVIMNPPKPSKAKSFVGLPDLHEIEEEHGSEEAGSRENSVVPDDSLLLQKDQKTPSFENMLNNGTGGKDRDNNNENGSLLNTRNASVVTCRIGNSTLMVDEMTNSRIIRVASKVTLNKPMYRDDIFYSGSLLRIPDYANNNTNISGSEDNYVAVYVVDETVVNSARMSDGSTQPMTSQEWTAAVTSPPEEEEDTVDAAGDATPKKRKGCCPGLGVINKMLDFSLLLSPTFVVFCISGMFAMVGLFVPFVFLMDQAFFVLRHHIQNDTASAAAPPEPDAQQEMELKESLTLLISVIGAANTVGRILSGWIADRPWVNALVLNNGAVTIMGLSTVLVPFLRQYYHFVLYSGTFGISMACFASLRSILVVELLGLPKLTNAFGLLLLFQGIASMVATPLAGIIAQTSGGDGDFSLAFFFAGASLLISALMCYPLNWLNHWEKRNTSKIIKIRI